MGDLLFRMVVCGWDLCKRSGDLQIRVDEGGGLDWRYVSAFGDSVIGKNSSKISVLGVSNYRGVACGMRECRWTCLTAECGAIAYVDGYFIPES